MRSPRVLLFALLSVAMVLAGCGSTTQDAATADVAFEGAAQSTDDAAIIETGGEAVPSAESARASRSIIFTGHLEIVADDVDIAVRSAHEVVERLGGYVFGEDSHRSGGTSSTIVYKLPPEQFRPALIQLGELGTVSFQNVSSEDVTDVVVDLQSRIATAEASVTRLRSLLEESGTISEITTVEQQLLARETTLEQLRGQLRGLETQASLSTITFSVFETAPEPPTDELPGVLDAISGGFQVLVGVLYLIVLALAALLPFLPILVIGLFGGRRLLPRLRSRFGKTHAAAAQAGDQHT